MSLDNLTNQELEVLKTQEGASAAVIGYLFADQGSLVLTHYNKHMEVLNYPKLKKVELAGVLDEINGDKVLSSILKKARDRKIILDDIPDYLTEESILKEEDSHDIITPRIKDQEANNAHLRERRNLQRSGARMDILMEEIKKSLLQELKSMPRAKYVQTKVPVPKSGDKSLILAVGDWHVGYLSFNSTKGGYDFKKLCNTVQDVAVKVKEIIRDLDIKHVYVFHLGDIIEHVSMRNVNQAFDAEFTASEQVSKALRLIIDLIDGLSSEVFVTFGIVSGNHDRYNGNKNDKIYNDTAVYTILDTLIMLQEERKQFPNVKFIDNRADTYEFTQEVAGKTILVKHGDSEKTKDERKIAKHIKDKPIDYFIMGHVHHTRILQEDDARFQIYVGSPIGANNFSKEINAPDTKGSQMMIVLTEGSDTPYFIPMMVEDDGSIK